MKKRIFSIVAALVLLFCLLSPVAAADQTTTVTYEVADAYTLIIPASGITLAQMNIGVVDNFGVAQGALISEGMSLKIKLTSLNCDGEGKFRMKNDADDTLYLGYTISGGNSNPVNENILKDVVFFTASAQQCYNGLSTQLTFTFTQAPIRAGIYTDTITFGVTIE